MAQKVTLATAEVPKELLTVKDLTRILGVSKNKAYQIIYSGGLAVVRVGERIRIRPETLQQWIEQHEQS